MKRIVLAIVCVIAAASIAVIAVLGVRISPLISSISNGTDFDDVTLKTEAVGISSLSVASLMPLAQAFTGDSFIVEGTIDLPPGTTSVDIPGLLNVDLEANAQSQAAAQASGWVFTQQYTSPDNNTAITILSDDSGNNSVFAAIILPEDQSPSVFITDLANQYSDMLTLFGFEVTDSSSTAGNQLQTITITQEETVLKVQIWADPVDPDKVNIAALKSTTEDINVAETDFAAFVALLGGT